MVATNDDILSELQKQTQILKSLRKISKGQYTEADLANKEDG